MTSTAQFSPDTVRIHELVVLKNVWQLVFGKTPVTVLKTDCRSLYDHGMHQKQVMEKRLIVHLATISDSLPLNELSRLEWVDTHHQLADAHTKHTTAVQLVEALGTGRITYRNAKQVWCATYLDNLMERS